MNHCPICGQSHQSHQSVNIQGQPIPDPFPPVPSRPQPCSVHLAQVIREQFQIRIVVVAGSDVEQKVEIRYPMCDL